MVRIEDFHIEFDDKWSVYRPGDEVTGAVTLRLNEKVFVDSVVANFYGLARVFWVDAEPKEGRFRNVTYSSENVYFNEKVQLWRYSGNENDGLTKEKNQELIQDEVDVEIEQLLRARRGKMLHAQSGPCLDPGQHKFLFSFRLPSDLPTSFDARSSHGYIRYSVKVCLMSQSAIKYSRKSYFTVVKPEDLNLMVPSVRQPISRQSGKMCANGFLKQPTQDCYIRLIGMIEKQGYVPGEPIFVQVHVHNQATKPMRLLKMHLTQNIICHVDNPEVKSRISSQSVCCISHTEKIREGSKLEWNAGPLYIPAVAPTFTVESCMQVSYSITVEAYRRDGAPKLVVSLPIIIGTVPLQPCDDSHQQMRQASGDDCIDHPPDYDTIVGIPPPTYEESQAGLSAQQEKEEACIPRYMVYKYN